MQFRDGHLLDPETFQRAPLAPVIRRVDDVRQLHNRVDGGRVDAVLVADESNRHQATRHILEDVTMLDNVGRFDAPVSGIGVHRFVEIAAQCAVSAFEPFLCRLRANAHRRRHRHPLSIQCRQHPRCGRRNPVHVKLEIALPRLDPPGIEQRQRGVEDCPHVVQPGVEHIFGRDELRIDRRERCQRFLCARRRERRNRHRELGAEDARFRWAIAARRKEESLRLADDGITVTATLDERLFELQCPAGTSRMQHDDVVVAQIGCRRQRNIAVP